MFLLLLLDIYENIFYLRFKKRYNRKIKHFCQFLVIDGKVLYIQQ